MEAEDVKCLFCNTMIPKDSVFCPSCEALQAAVPVIPKGNYRKQVDEFESQMERIRKNGIEGKNNYLDAKKKGANPIGAAVICSTVFALAEGAIVLKNKYEETHVANVETGSVNGEVDTETNSLAESPEYDDEGNYGMVIYDYGGGGVEESADWNVQEQVFTADGNVQDGWPTEGDSSEYIIPDSDSRLLTPADVEGRSKDDIQLIINEIYARHGRPFSTEVYRNYFESKSWYQCVEGKTDVQVSAEFNSYENANIEFLKQYR